MTEYYGYVRRNAKSQVDWGSISKGITKDISKISQDREKKRGDLDKMNQDLVRASNELDLTDVEHVNRLILDGADQAKQLALMNNKLLKSGILKPSDYSLAMENMKSGVSGLSKAIKEFNPAFKRDMERMAKNEIGFVEAWEKENLFKYGNLKDKTLHLNTDGSFSFAEVDENGDIIADPSKMMNVGVMAKMLGATRAKFDVVNEVKVGADRAASVLEVVKSSEGLKGVLTEEDARRNPKYQEARDNFIDSLLTNEVNVAEVLGNFLGVDPATGEKYEMTNNKDEAGGNKVYQDANGNIKLTDEQVKVAREALTTEFETQVGKKQTPKPTYAPTSSSGGGGSGSKDEEIISLNLKRLIQGTSEEVDTASSFFRSQNPKLKGISKTKDGFTITTSDDEVVEISASGNPTLIANQLLGWLSPGKVSNPDEIIRKLNITSVSPNEGASQASKKYVETADMMVLDSNDDPVTFYELLSKEEPDENDVNKINKALKDIDPNITVKASGDRFSTQDKISVFYSGKLIEDLNYDDPGDEEALINVIDRLRKGDTTPTPTTGAATGKPNLNASTRNKQ
jgi:hypothetical protein